MNTKLLTAALATPQAGGRELVIVPGATHSFPARAAAAVSDAVVSFLGGRPV